MRDETSSSRQEFIMRDKIYFFHSVYFCVFFNTCTCFVLLTMVMEILFIYMFNFRIKICPKMPICLT